MSRALAIASFALAGCYATFHGGGSAPLGHGHGDAGVEVDLAGGAEHFDNRMRAGGGFALGSHHGNDEDYDSFGFDGHVVVAVGGQPYAQDWRPLVIANAVVGIGVGSAAEGSTEQPATYFAQTFVGFGIGSPTSQPDYNVNAGHVALGLVATHYWPEFGDGFWTLGAALELSFAWFQKK